MSRDVSRDVSHSQRRCWEFGSPMEDVGISLVFGYRKLVIPLSGGWEPVLQIVDGAAEAKRIVDDHRAFYHRHLGLACAELCFGYRLARKYAPMQSEVVFRPIFRYDRGRQAGLVCAAIPKAVEDCRVKWAPRRRTRIAAALFFGLHYPYVRQKKHFKESKKSFKIAIPKELAELIASFAF